MGKSLWEIEDHLLWLSPKKEYMLKSLPKDRKAYGGFEWPAERGTIVMAPDWDPVNRCGFGLHGLYRGEGMGQLLYDGEDAVWFVLEVNPRDVVDLQDKVKVPNCTVAYCGDRDTAVQLMRHRYPRSIIPYANVQGQKRAVAGYRGTAKVCDSGKAIAGDHGVATAGVRGKAIAGYQGKATANTKGTAIVGDYGRAAAGDHGKAIAGRLGVAITAHRGKSVVGPGGIAMTGPEGTIEIQYIDGFMCRRTKKVRIDKYGLAPGVPYRLDDENNFVLAPGVPYRLDDENNFGSASITA